MKHDFIRIGRISAIDYKRGMARIVYHDRDTAVTEYFHTLTLNKEYHMPKIGDMVLILHLTNGASTGIILGKYWGPANLPPEYGKEIYRKDFAREDGETYLKYDDKKKKVTFVANYDTVFEYDGKTKTITVTADNMEIIADNINIKTNNINVAAETVTVTANDITFITQKGVTNF